MKKSLMYPSLDQTKLNINIKNTKNKMRIDINPKKELFKWGSIKFKLIYPSIFVEVILLRVTKYCPWFWPPILCIVKNGIVTWVCEDLSLGKEGLKYFLLNQ